MSRRALDDSDRNFRRVMIIGLAVKNAILIVEFAKVRTDKGMDAKSSAARNDTGTAVVSGMLAATFIGIFLIPVFFRHRPIFCRQIQSLVTSQNDYDNAPATLSNLSACPFPMICSLKTTCLIKSRR